MDALIGLGNLLASRYGREGDIAERGYGVSLREAGYATGGGWWGLQAALDASGTSFEAEQLETRWDLLLHDIVLYPEDPPGCEWAVRYGYRSADAAARAFRTRFGIALADARRIGRVGQWLVLANRHRRSPVGASRVEEAKHRIVAFRRAVRGPVGVAGREALRELGRSTPDNAAHHRPRYPPIGLAEAARLSSELTLDA